MRGSRKLSQRESNFDVVRKDPNTPFSEPSATRQQNAIQMAFCWWADDSQTLNAQSDQGSCCLFTYAKMNRDYKRIYAADTNTRGVRKIMFSFISRHNKSHDMSIKYLSHNFTDLGTVQDILKSTH